MARIVALEEVFGGRKTQCQGCGRGIRQGDLTIACRVSKKLVARFCSWACRGGQLKSIALAKARARKEEEDV